MDFREREMKFEKVISREKLKIILKFDKNKVKG